MQISIEDEKEILLTTISNCKQLLIVPGAESQSYYAALIKLADSETISRLREKDSCHA